MHGPLIAVEAESQVLQGGLAVVPDLLNLHKDTRVLLAWFCVRSRMQPATALDIGAPGWDCTRATPLNLSEDVARTCAPFFVT